MAVWVTRYFVLAVDNPVPGQIRIVRKFFQPGQNLSYMDLAELSERAIGGIAPSGNRGEGVIEDGLLISFEHKQANDSKKLSGRNLVTAIAFAGIKTGVSPVDPFFNRL